MELHCPECHSIVYSRRALLCGVCGKRLPDSFRFYGEQAEKIEGEGDPEILAADAGWQKRQQRSARSLLAQA